MQLKFNNSCPICISGEVVNFYQLQTFALVAEAGGFIHAEGQLRRLAVSDSVGARFVCIGVFCATVAHGFVSLKPACEKEIAGAKKPQAQRTCGDSRRTSAPAF